MADCLPDIIARDLAVLFCGINPGLQAAASGHHFAGRGNRFWRVMHLAGFTPHVFMPEEGRLLRYGCGLTTVVERASARADQLSQGEFLAAKGLFERKIGNYAPRFIAFLGKAAYRALSGYRHIDWGLQPGLMKGPKVWILPNPSGRNRGFSLDQLVQAYRELHDAAFGLSRS